MLMIAAESVGRQYSWMIELQMLAMMMKIMTEMVVAVVVVIVVVTASASLVSCGS